jgi:hypothetical protein
MTSPVLKPEEIVAADALSRTLQGSYRKGEDPPDIYLDVMITRLAQYGTITASGRAHRTMCLRFGT